MILFDVSDLTQPIQIAEYTFERFSTSEAQIDHHAFGYFATHGILAMPTSRTYYQRVDEDGDGYRETRETVREDQLSVLNIDVEAGANAIGLAGEISHDTAVRRSGYIDQYLFSMSDDSVQVAHVDNLELIVAAIDTTDPNDNPPDPGIDPPTPEPTAYPATVPAGALAEAIEQAQGHLANQLQTQTGVSALVSAESAGAAEGASYRLVLRTGDAQYLYFVRGDDSPLLSNDAYTFADQGQNSAWHAIQTAGADPADYNLDGKVDGGDLPLWQASYGFDAAADTDGDHDADGKDFLTWQQQTSLTQAVARSVDVDSDGDVDGRDFLAMQHGHGVDDPLESGELLAWQVYYTTNVEPQPLNSGAGSAALSAALATHPGPLSLFSSELIDAAIAFAQSDQDGSATVDRELVESFVSLEPTVGASQANSQLAPASRSPAQSTAVGQRTAAADEPTEQHLSEDAVDLALAEFSAI